MRPARMDGVACGRLTECDRCFGGVHSLCAPRQRAHGCDDPAGLQAPCAQLCGPGGMTCLSRDGGQQEELRAARDMGVRRWQRLMARGLNLLPHIDVYVVILCL